MGPHVLLLELGSGIGARPFLEQYFDHLELADEPESRVTWEIEAQPGGFSKLTLIHDQLDASPNTAASVRGWSYILSNLKTVIETDSALPPLM